MNKKYIAVGLAGLLAAALLLPSAASAKAKKSGPVVVGTDPADDWGSNTDPGVAPIGNALGMELVEASIAMADAKTINFVIKVAASAAVRRDARGRSLHMGLHRERRGHHRDRRKVHELQPGRLRPHIGPVPATS